MPYKLLVVSVVFILLLIVNALFIEIVDFPVHAQEYQFWLSSQPLTINEQVGMWVGLIALTVSALAAIMIIFYRSPSRIIFLAMIILSLICELLPNNPILILPIENFLSSTISIVAGVIIVLSFVVKEEKKKSKVV